MGSHYKGSRFLVKRDWLRFEGADAQRFLNGMWTADLNRAAKTEGPIAGGAWLLNIKGKPVGTGIFLKQSPNCFWFSVPQGSGSQILESLNKLIVADDVEGTLFEANDSKAMWSEVWEFPFGLDRSFQKEPRLEPNSTGAQDVLVVAEEHDWGLRIFRGKLSVEHEELWIKSGKVLPNLGDYPLLSSKEYLKFRIEAGVPEWGIDLNSDSLILEYPVQDEISFQKGCYIGQEVVARATYRGKMTRFFCKVKGQHPLESGFVFSSANPDQPVGKLTSVNETEGLGVFRLSSLEGASEFFLKTDDGNKIFLKSVNVLGGIKVPS